MPPKRSAAKQHAAPQSVVMTPTPRAMAPASDDEYSDDDEEDEDDDDDLTKKNTRSNFKIHGKKNNDDDDSVLVTDAQSVSQIVLIVVVFVIVVIGVCLQWIQVEHVMNTLREEGAKKVALKPLEREFSELRKKYEELERGQEVIEKKCERVENEQRRTVEIVEKKAVDVNVLSAQSVGGGRDDRAAVAFAKSVSEELEKLKKEFEAKPWDGAMQKTIDAWYDNGASGGSEKKKSTLGWFGKADSTVTRLPPWTAKDTEIEKMAEALRLDVEDVKLKLAKKGLSTQSAMQRLTSALADRTGLPDYANMHGGGRVLKHSTLSPLVARDSGPIAALLMYIRGKAAPHPKSHEWLLKHTLEPPGDCLALRGTKGYVDVHLKEKITITGFTLEHVNPLIAYDRSSAPKDVKFGAWGVYPKHNNNKPLNNTNEDKNNNSSKSIIKSSRKYEDFGDFTFDPMVSDGVTTFMFSEDKVVGTTDRVRLSIESNHGNSKWTCVYRLRVHGTPKNSKLNGG